MNIQTHIAERDQSIHKALFACIDGAQWHALPSLFCTSCRYERPGYDPIDGIDALLNFYRHERIIQSGKHSVELIAQTGDVIFCEGHFEGTSKDGAALSERFVDRYMMVDDKISHRQTYFYRPAV